MTLPKAYDGCTCICHRQAGVRHFFACCGAYSPVTKVRQNLAASGIEAATADETAQQARPKARARPDAQTPTQSPSYSKYRGSVAP